MLLVVKKKEDGVQGIKQETSSAAGKPQPAMKEESSNLCMY